MQPHALLLIALLMPQQPPVPKPFPQPGSGQPAKPAPPPPPSSRPTQPTPAQTAPPPPAARSSSADADAPTEASLGIPLYPGAQYIKSYDAGRGQRFYLFGTTAPFVDLVTYYRERLKQ